MGHYVNPYVLYFLAKFVLSYIHMGFMGGSMNVLKKINKMRLERGWSTYRLSVESGISQSTLTNMFNRETLPSITTLECLCNAFGITMSEFFAEAVENPTAEQEEKELLRLFSKMTSEEKQSLLLLLRGFSKQ